MLDVYLYQVGRNLNRSYRTCEAFGVQRLFLIDCNPKLSGHLFKASGRVQVFYDATLPDPSGLLALDTFYKMPISDVIKQHQLMINKIIIGGETAGLPRSLPAEYKAVIPMNGHISGLTVEAALAIGLYVYTSSL